MACPCCEAEKKSSMRWVVGAGGSEEWDKMNQKNQRMINQWMKSKETQVNKGKDIGLPMIEWTD